MDLIWFSCGLGGENVLTWKGNIVSDPPPLISSQLAVSASSFLRKDKGLWNFMSVSWCQLRALDFYINISEH